MRARELVVILLAAATLPAQRHPDLRIDRGTPPGASASTAPAIAIAGDTIAVAWSDQRNGGDFDIYFNRSIDGGRSWLPADVRLDTGSAPGAASSFAPEIALSGSGVVVVWRDDRNTGFGLATNIFANRSLDGGVTWLASDVQLDVSNVFGFATFQQVSIAGQTVHVTWEARPAGDRDVFYRRSLDGGATWPGPEVRIDVGDAPGANQSFTPRHAVSGSDVHVVWSDERRTGSTFDIFYNRSFDGGVTWLPAAVRIDNVAGASSGQSVGPQIAAVGSTVSVAWSGSPFSSPSNNNDVYFNRSTDRGATWQPNDLRINTAVPAGGASTVLTGLRAAGGALFATWLDTFAGRGIRFNRSFDGGVTWLATDVGVNTPRSGPVQLPQRPHLAVAGTTVVVAWTNVVGATRDVHCNRSMDAGTTWLASDMRLNTGVPAGSSRAELRSLGFDGTTPWAAWSDDRNGLNDIYINAAFGFVPYGIGTGGTGGVVPRAFGQGVALIGSTVDHRIDNALGGAPGLMAFGVQKDSIPLFGGELLVDPLATLVVVLGGGSGQAGAGAVTVPTTLPNDPAFVGLGFFVQGFVLDPAAASGVALTNGLETWIG